MRLETKRSMHKVNGPLNFITINPLCHLKPKQDMCSPLSLSVELIKLSVTTRYKMMVRKGGGGNLATAVTFSDW